MSFDWKRYAQLQEHRLSSGGSMLGDISSLCVMQAWSWCVDGNELSQTMEMGPWRRAEWGHRTKSTSPGDIPIDLCRRLIDFNNVGSQEDRDWLLSILPELPDFDALLLRRNQTAEAPALETVSV